MIAQCAITSDSLGDSENAAKWVQVATEGQYLGYNGGASPFVFDRKTFQEVVANIRSNPAYKMGADGFGETDVVGWDFNHASEMSPAAGTMPLSGSPAQGWTRDFKIVDGADGKAQLWALTRFLEPARTYIKAGQYKWASVALAFDAVDPLSGKNVGSIVTSIALTNQPFIAGMQPLVASRQSGASAAVVAGHYGYFSAASTPGEAFCSLRELFGLPITASVPEVVAQIGKVKQWLDSGNAPLGIELDEIVGCMRTILGVPALTSATDVIDSVGQMVSRLIEESAASSAVIGAKTSMDILKILATLLGVIENEAAVRSAVEELVTLRAELIKKLQLSSVAASRVVLEAASVNADAGLSLASLLKALGTTNVNGAVERIATLLQHSDDLAKAQPELEKLRASMKQVDEATQETDVTSAMASYKMPEDAREALLLMRRQDPKRFAEKYPSKAPKAGDPKLLTAHLTATGGGEKKPLGISGEIPDLIVLSQYTGRNPTEQAMTYLASKNVNWNSMTHEQKVSAALHLKRQPNVVLSLAAN